MAAEPKQSCDSLSMSSPSSPPEYAPLHGKDMDSVDGLDMLPHHRVTRRKGRFISIVKILSGAVVLGFIVLTFGMTFHAVELLGKIGHMVKEVKPSASHQRSYKYPCGETAAEAKAKGCIFDIMAMVWQSPECYDPDLAMEFADLGPWEFYTDPSGTEKMSLDQISKEGQISWTTRRYFVQHCIFGWKAMHRAWQRGWRMDSNLASIEHTELCSRVFANTSIPLDALTTRIHVDFPSCN